jgi:hypothetical protein
MRGTGVNIIRKAQLPDPSQALKIGMFYDVEQALEGDVDEPVYRVIDDLFFIRRHPHISGHGFLPGER